MGVLMYKYLNVQNKIVESFIFSFNRIFTGFQHPVDCYQQGVKNIQYWKMHCFDIFNCKEQIMKKIEKLRQMRLW